MGPIGPLIQRRQSRQWCQPNSPGLPLKRPQRVSTILRMDRFAEITVVGAGVVGLAVATELAESGRDVLVLERNESFGRETSSRNSEVIHAGLYYQPGSLKARLCVEGRELLYRICREHGIGHRRITKLIVATKPDEIPRLEALAENARHCGVEDLCMLGSAEIHALEPEVRAIAALLSPSTGIVDTHGLMSHFARKAKDCGATLSFNSEVIALEKMPQGWRVTVKEPKETHTFETGIVINCAGLGSDRIAAAAGIDADASGYRLHYCKGNYFSISPAKGRRVGRLVYPAPHANAAGLGVHLTLDLGGRARLGPNTVYVDAVDYQVDVSLKESFYRGAVRFLPFLAETDLEPDMAGVRPKLQGPGEPFRDFVIHHEADRGLEGLFNLIGIESPGLTSCAAIARYVRELVDAYRPR
jgi:L-2-hydroxyglutarate oxidase LhgO